MPGHELRFDRLDHFAGEKLRCVAGKLSVTYMRVKGSVSSL